MKERLDLITVDDSESFCKLTKRLIEEKYNINVKYFTKVIQSIKDTEKLNPKLVIFDIVFDNNPIHNNGFEIIEKNNTNSKFIILTSQKNKQNIEKARKLKVKSIIYKSSEYSKSIISILKKYQNSQINQKK